MIYRQTLQVPSRYPTTSRFVSELLSALEGHEMSVKEMMVCLQLKDRMNFLKIYLKPALEQNLVEMKYPDQPNHPKQRYRLVDKK